MDLDFEDYLGAELPFIRDNPHEADLVEVIELDGTGNVLDVVTTNPCHLGALEDDYHLEPIIDETTDNMPFEMSELLSADRGDYLDDIEELGVTFGGKVSGSVGTSGGLTGRIRGGTKRSTKRRSAKKPSRASLLAKAKAKRIKARALRRIKIDAAKKKAAKIERIKAIQAKTRRRIKIDAAKKKIIEERKATKPSWGIDKIRETIRAKQPQIIARPKLAAAGVSCGCAQIGRIEGMLKKAAVQRIATSEHKTLINQKQYRTRTIGQLRAILGRLSTRDRSRVIRAACGMGGG